MFMSHGVVSQAGLAPFVLYDAGTGYGAFASPDFVGGPWYRYTNPAFATSMVSFEASHIQLENPSSSSFGSRWAALFMQRSAQAELAHGTIQNWENLKVDLEIITSGSGYSTMSHDSEIGTTTTNTNVNPNHFYRTIAEDVSRQIIVSPTSGIANEAYIAFRNYLANTSPYTWTRTYKIHKIWLE